MIVNSLGRIPPVSVHDHGLGERLCTRSRRRGAWITGAPAAGFEAELPFALDVAT